MSHGEQKGEIRWALKALAAAWIAGALGMACGDEGGSSEPVACASDPNGKAVGCVYGKLVDQAGKPMAGIRVSVCTDKECIRGDSKSDGTYDIQGLTVDPHHVEVLGEPAGVYTMVWWQDVQAGVQTRLDEEVVLQPLEGAEKVAWVPDAGGKVVLAKGRLELEAQPGTLKYGPGLEKVVHAIEIDVDEIPPFDIEPWKGKEAETRAFVVNPFPLKASVAVRMKVLGEDGVATGKPYTIYTADPIWGNLEEVGLMTADGSGALVSEPGGSLKELTTIIVVPN